MNDLTADWLDCFNTDVEAEENLADSVFWRLAASGTLPLGVDGDHPRVKAAIEEIKASMAERNG